MKTLETKQDESQYYFKNSGPCFTFWNRFYIFSVFSENKRKKRSRTAVVSAVQETDCIEPAEHKKSREFPFTSCTLRMHNMQDIWDQDDQRSLQTYEWRTCSTWQTVCWWQKGHQPTIWYFRQMFHQNTAKVQSESVITYLILPPKSVRYKRSILHGKCTLVHTWAAKIGWGGGGFLD